MVVKLKRMRGETDGGREREKEKKLQSKTILFTTLAVLFVPQVFSLVTH